MKTWILVIALAASSLFTFAAVADEAQTMPLANDTSQIPTEEKAFVKAINQFNKAKIVELLGEPAKMDDIKLKSSGRVVASIWHYHNINTAEDGSYYPTTELD